MEQLLKPLFVFSLLLALFCMPLAWSQEDTGKEKSKYKADEEEDTLGRFSYGLNVGFYFPDNHPATFYNGSPVNDNKLDLILRNQYYRKDIEDTLGYKLDSAHPYDLPSKMRYSAAYTIGFYFRYQLDKSLGIFASFNFVKLEAKDVFLLNLDLPEGYNLDPRYRQFPIWGKEKRVNIDVGISKYFPLAPKTTLFVEGGLNMNNVRVIENKIAINNTAYSLVNVYGNQSYIPNSQLQQYQVIQGGVGFGMFASSGVRLVFSDYLSLDPGFTFYWKGINLGKYDGFRPNFTAFVRFTFKKLL
jgi:hypothetical protein